MESLALLGADGPVSVTDEDFVFWGVGDFAYLLPNPTAGVTAGNPAGVEKLAGKGNEELPEADKEEETEEEPEEEDSEDVEEEVFHNFSSDAASAFSPVVMRSADGGEIGYFDSQASALAFARDHDLKILPIH